MKFNINIVKPVETVEQNTVLSEARARIIWGDSISSVRDYLISNGLSATDADAKIKEFDFERYKEIRRLGVKNILIGLALIGVAVILLYQIYTSSRIGSLNVRRGSGIGMMGFVGFYGIWKLISGIIYFVRPKSESGSIPDISE